MSSSVARGTLKAARFFVAQAERSVRSDDDALRHYLEAAIVFGRSVSFHVQSEFSKQPGFEPWYAEWQERLKRNQLAKYFLDKRNYVLKAGRLGLRHELSIGFSAVMVMTGHVSVKVIRGQPWYRRPPSILWQDAVAPIRTWLVRRREDRAQRRRQREHLARQAAEAARPRKYSVGFVDAPLQGSATALLAQYLDELELLVSDAEARFTSAGGAV